MSDSLISERRGKGKRDKVADQEDDNDEDMKGDGYGREMGKMSH